MTLYGFPDPMLATLTVLRAQAPTVASYGTLPYESFPVGNGPPLPYAMVRPDGTDIRYPVSATATLGLTVWAAVESDTYPVAYHLAAVLRDYAGDADVRRFALLTGPISTTDPATGLAMATFSAEARLRPHAI